MQQDIRPTKLADAVARHIETLVLEGVLRPGEKLLPERDLAERFEVSRPSLREALQKLAEKRVLVVGRDGAFVAQNFASSLTDPLARLLGEYPHASFDYLEFRASVDGSAAYFAALRATDADRAMLGAVMERMEAAHLELESAAEAEADTNLHMAVYEAAHNVVLLHVMRALADMLRSDVFYNRDTLYSRRGVRDLLLDQHRAICEAVMAGDPQAAKRAAEGHIRFTSDTLREIRDAEARQEVALRRLGRSDLIAAPGRRAPARPPA